SRYWTTAASARRPTVSSMPVTRSCPRAHPNRAAVQRVHEATWTKNLLRVLAVVAAVIHAREALVSDCLAGVVTRAVFDAVRAGELTRTQAEVFDQLDAGEAARALAVARIAVWPIATTRTVDGVVGAAREQLRTHGNLDAVLRPATVGTRH